MAIRLMIAIVIMLVLAVALARTARRYGTSRTPFDGLITGVLSFLAGAILGGILGFAPMTIGPKLGGVWIIPAVIGEIIGGVVVLVLLRQTPHRPPQKLA